MGREDVEAQYLKFMIFPELLLLCIC